MALKAVNGKLSVPSKSTRPFSETQGCLLSRRQLLPGWYVLSWPAGVQQSLHLVQLTVAFASKANPPATLSYDIVNGLSFRFSEHQKCRVEIREVSDLLFCYMDYFGIDHQGGFDAGEDIEDRDDDDDPHHYAPKRTSVPDLRPIFDFIRIYTGCDLINEPNTKCKREHKEGRWRPYIDRNNPEGRDEFPHKIPGRHAKGHLKIKSKRKFVKISYKEDNGECEGDSRESFKRLFDTSIKDGPHFPIPRTLQNLIKVKKQGRDHQKFKIEINSGPSRVLLILTGKSKLWFRVHCYDCGAWVEIKANCEERVIKYSNGRGQQKKVEPKEGTIHVPLETNNSGECTLWNDGSTEETQRRRRERKGAKKHSNILKKLKPKTKPKLIKKLKAITREKSTTPESLERKESTEVKKQEPKGKSFGDWIIPPSVRKAVKKISSIKNVKS